MDEQAVRERAEAFCAALVTGNVDQAAQELSNELRSNLGHLVGMLPLPITTATIELVDRTASGFRLELELVGETSQTTLETRWKERDDRPVIVEVSHLAATPIAAEEEEGEEAAPPE